MFPWHRHIVNTVNVYVLTLAITINDEEQCMLGMGLYWPEEALLEHRETSSFPDQHIWDLTNLYADEEYSVAQILLVQPLTEGLEAEDTREEFFGYYAFTNLNITLTQPLCVGLTHERKQMSKGRI